MCRTRVLASSAMDDLASKIAAGTVAPVYVLSSEEPLLVDRVIVALRRQVVVEATAAFNYDVLEGKAGGHAVVNAARTLPMMAPRRLVLVRDAEALAAAGLEALLPYLADPSPHTVLALVFGKVDGRLKFFLTAKKRGYFHDLPVPRQLPPWILDEARRRGARFTDAAARRLADVVGRDLGRLSSAIDQLALYAGDHPVSPDDVDDLVAETRERTVFELANAVFDGDRARALKAAGRLFDQQESAVGVAMMLARHVRQVALAREHLAARTPPRELPSALGVPPFAVDGLVAQARRTPEAAIGRAIALLAKADRDLKGPVKGALGERVVVERLVGELVGLGEPTTTRGGRPGRAW